MHTSNEFEILIRRKMPFVSTFLYGLIIFFLVFLFILYIFMYPATHSRSSPEMRAAYYLLVVPDSIKVLSSYSLYGFLVVIPLYYRARLHKSAILSFNENSINISGKKIKIEILESKIKKVYFNDLKNYLGIPKQKLQIVIQQKGDKLTTFRLKDYEKGGELIEIFGSMQHIYLTGYDREMVSDHDDDDCR